MADHMLHLTTPTCLYASLSHLLYLLIPVLQVETLPILFNARTYCDVTVFTGVTLEKSVLPCDVIAADRGRRIPTLLLTSSLLRGEDSASPHRRTACILSRVV
jgi:hypothetical protein